MRKDWIYFFFGCKIIRAETYSIANANRFSKREVKINKILNGFLKENIFAELTMHTWKAVEPHEISSSSSFRHINFKMLPTFSVLPTFMFWTAFSIPNCNRNALHLHLNCRLHFSWPRYFSFLLLSLSLSERSHHGFPYTHLCAATDPPLTILITMLQSNSNKRNSSSLLLVNVYYRITIETVYYIENSC